MTKRMTAAAMCGLLTVLLAGCASAERIKAREAAENAAEDAKCKSFGAVPGTQPYLNCRLTLHQQKMANQALVEAAAQQGSSAAQMNAATSLMTGR